MEKQLMHPNPNPPDQDPSPIIPVVYEDEKYHWEYNYIRQQLDEEGPLDKKGLNELGKEGWELVTVFGYDNIAHYYFKRLVG